LGVALAVTGAQGLRASPREPAVPASTTAPGPSPSVHSDGPPPGHTGGFDEPTCQTCHQGFELGLDGTLTFEGLPDSYEGGEVYLVTLVLRSTEMVKAGFQASARFSSGDHRGRQAGALRAIDRRAAVVESKNVPGLQYIQHVEAGTGVRSGDLATWTFEWTAPVGTSEPVRFNATANSANGDDSPLGDLVYATSADVKGTRGPPATRPPS
jgi:hypothetical protein